MVYENRDPKASSESDELDHQDGMARAYLHANCGYCHNPNGLAASSGLMLDFEERDSGRLGLCKRPVADGVSSAWGRFDIDPGHPERSLMVGRMSSLAPGFAMPEIGRSVVDAEGVSIISAWISRMYAGCERD